MAYMPTVSNLFLISALLCVVQLLVLCSLVRSGIAGIREWCLANGIAIISFILYALGRELPPLIAYELANASYAWATSAMVVGFCRYFGKKVPWRMLFIVNLLLVAAIAWFHYVQYSFAARTIAVSMSQGVFLLLPASCCCAAVHSGVHLIPIFSPQPWWAWSRQAMRRVPSSIC